MATTTTCDACGNPIDPTLRETVHVSVNDAGFMRLAEGHRFYAVLLDLHRACYEALLLPAIDAIQRPDVATDG